MMNAARRRAPHVAAGCDRTRSVTEAKLEQTPVKRVQVTQAFIRSLPTFVSPALGGTTASTAWPPKVELFGIKITPTSYAEAVQTIVARAAAGQGGIVDLMPVHGLVTSVTDAGYGQMMNEFDMVAPDGQPVRWALNRIHHVGLRDRVYGPELMLRLCAATARKSVSIYLFGSSAEVIKRLEASLVQQFPGLIVAGAESPPYRALTPDEDAAVVERINASGAGVLFLGTGCPRQEVFAFEHRDRVRAVQVCVGAAFDFHAGTKRMAPPWMQRRGLEWLFRLGQEPRRLGRRYLVTNSIFIGLVVRRLLRGH